MWGDLLWEVSWWFRGCLQGGIHAAAWIPDCFWLGSLGEKTPISLIVEFLVGVAVGVGVPGEGLWAARSGTEGSEGGVGSGCLGGLRSFCDGGVYSSVAVWLGGFWRGETELCADLGVRFCLCCLVLSVLLVAHLQRSGGASVVRFPIFCSVGRPRSVARV